MTAAPRMVWGRDLAGIGPDVAMFAVAIGLAWFLGWKTTDLLWSTWFTGLVVGYAALVVGLAGEWRRRRGNPFAGVLLTGTGLFFTVHFLGINWIMAYVLPQIASVDELRGGVWQTHFWVVLATHYWPMLLMTVVTEREMLRGAFCRFDRVSPYLPVVRTWAVFLPLAFVSLLGDMTKLFTIDHLGCYTLAALVYFSPWRLGRETERS